MDRRQRQRALWAGAGLGAAFVHLILLIVLQPEADQEPPLLQPERAIQVTLGPPFPPRPESPDDTPRQTPTREALAPDPDPASLPSLRSLGPRARPTPAAPSGGLPATPGSTNAPGVNWTLTDPPESAMRRVLRRSVGCDYDLKRSKAEQDACDERFGRNRLKEPTPTRLVADRRRARELEAQADHAMRLHEYKRQPAPDGTFNDLREMGGQAPRPND